MRHYEIGAWADFVRNLLSEREKAEMEQHLASDCTECVATVDFVRQVAAAAASERAYEAASEELAVAAREIFQARGAGRLGKFVEALRVLVAQLTYDSASDLLPEGARAHRSATRQMMFQAGDFCLDLRLDRELNSRRVTLVGQLANPKDSQIQLAKLQVLILSGEKILTQASINEFGEFSLDYMPRPNLRLCVPINDAGVRVEVPLKSLLEEHEA
jgi:hypothetical protein